MRRVFFAGLSVSLLLGAMSYGGSLLYFIDASALLIVTFGTLAVSLVVAPEAVLVALPAALRAWGTAPRPRSSTLVAITGARRLQHIARCVGGVVMGLGSLDILSNFADPTMLGPALAVALLGLLYSVVLSEGILGPLANGLQGSLHSIRPACRQQGEQRHLLVALLAAVAAGVAAPRALIDVPSALYVVALALCISLTHHTAADLGSALRVATRLSPRSAAASARQLAALSTLRQGLSLAGSSGLLIGVMQILGSLADPSALGPALTVAFLPWLYALVLAEVILSPLISRLRTGAAEPEVPSASGLSSVLVLGAPALGSGGFLLLTGMLMGL